MRARIVSAPARSLFALLGESAKTMRAHRFRKAACPMHEGRFCVGDCRRPIGDWGRRRMSGYLTTLRVDDRRPRPGFPMSSIGLCRLLDIGGRAC